MGETPWRFKSSPRHQILLHSGDEPEHRRPNRCPHLLSKRQPLEGGRPALHRARKGAQGPSPFDEGTARTAAGIGSSLREAGPPAIRLYTVGGRTVQEVPDQLRPFTIGRASEEILGVTEAAPRLGVSRTTVYEWSERHTLIAWTGTKRELMIPAAQIVGAGRVVPGAGRYRRGHRRPRTGVDVPESGMAFRGRGGATARQVERRATRGSAVGRHGIWRNVYVSGEHCPRRLIERMLVHATVPASYPAKRARLTASGSLRMT